MHESYSENIVKLKVEEGEIELENDLTLYYKTMGEGYQSVILLHGGPGFTSNYMSPDLRELACGRRLIFYDQRGSGYSSPIFDENQISIDLMVEDLETLRKHFKLDKIVIIGHSWGALLAAFYAIKYPQYVDKMVLIGSAGANHESMKGIDFMARLTDREKEAVTYLFSPDIPYSKKICWYTWSILIRCYHTNTENARRLWGDICNKLPAYYKFKENNLISVLNHMKENYLEENQPDITPDLEKVLAPTLVIHGDNDPLPISAAMSYVDSLPNAEFVKFTDSGHFPWLDSPAKFFPLVDQFLNRNRQEEKQKTSKNGDEALSNRQDYDILFDTIKTLSEKFAVLISNKKWTQASELFTDDGTTYPPASPPISGKIGIATLWEILYSKGMRSLELQTVEVEGMGNRVLEIGKYVIRGENKDILDVGKFMVIWKMTENGWCLYKDMFNTSLDTRSPFEIPYYLPPPYGKLKLDFREFSI